MSKLDGSEQVLCVPAGELRRTLRGFHYTDYDLSGKTSIEMLPQGFRAFTSGAIVSDVLTAILCLSRWLPRTEALESDPAWKQIIPYGILTHDSRVFCYQRTKQASEGRLEGKMSIGIGGHVNTEDCPDDWRLNPYTLERCLDRETDEEIKYWHTETRCLGLLNDDSNDVGRVHIGIVYQRIATSEAWLDGPEIRGEGFATTGQLRGNIGEYENWSRILIENLEEILGGEHGQANG